MVQNQQNCICLLLTAEKKVSNSVFFLYVMDVCVLEKWCMVRADDNKHKKVIEIRLHNDGTKQRKSDQKKN